MFILFEGSEGSGKSTQAKSLHAHFQKKYPDRNVRIFNCPGSSNFGLAIRSIVLERAEPMAQPMEELLFLAAVFELWSVHILPALNAGDIVICDRLFYTTIVYQGFMKDLFGGKRRVVSTINNYTTPDLVLSRNIPAICVNMIYPPEVVLKRLAARAAVEAHNVYDLQSEDFHGRASRLFRLVIDDTRLPITPHLQLVTLELGEHETRDGITAQILAQLPIN